MILGETQGKASGKPKGKQNENVEWGLDADEMIEEKVENKNRSNRDDWDDRGSRSETKDQMMVSR